MSSQIQIEESLDHPKMQFFTSIGSDPGLVRVVGKCVNNIVATALNESDTTAYELCVVEAINNILEHGSCDNPNAVIDVEIKVLADRVDSRVRDDGSTIPIQAFENAAKFKIDPENIESLPEGGMGIFLITKSMNEFSYSTDSVGRNCLYMTRYITPGAAEVSEIGLSADTTEQH